MLLIGRAALLEQQPQQLRSPQQTGCQPGGGVATVTQGRAGLSTVSTEQQITRQGTSGKTVGLNANLCNAEGKE